MADFVKKHWAPISVLAAICLAMFLAGEKLSSKISDVTQAIAIVTLVAVTWYYAKQTKLLTDQQQNTLKEVIQKRHIDFLERRIEEFCVPACNQLSSLRVTLRANDLVEFGKEVGEFWRFIAAKGYLSSRETTRVLRIFSALLVDAVGKQDWDACASLLKEKYESLIGILGKDIELLEVEIRTSYEPKES